MRWPRAGLSWVVRSTVARAHPYANRGRSSTPAAAATERQAQGERSTYSVLGLGCSQASERTSAAAAERLSASAYLAPSAAIGSREAAASLLEGIAEALAVEAREAKDYEVSERIVWLLVDVFEAVDAITGQ